MAESVIVRIEEDHGKITLSVQDDGTGFNTFSKHAGIGLEIMQERANAIGGELTIRSEAERGSCVTISVDMIKETPNK